MSEEMELKESRAMVYLPENAVEVEIKATIFSNGELVKVGKIMALKEIQESFRDAEENYIGSDDRFVLTEKGLKWLEELEAKEND